MWQENIGILESTRFHEMWVKIKAAVNNLGPSKLISNVKTKYEILKTLIKDQMKTFPSLLRIFSLQLALPSSLEVAVQIYPGCENPCIYFKN